MSKRFFTSDLHLNSALINKYAQRPYLDAESAATALVTNINSDCAAADTLIHVGDFALTSVDAHGKEADIPLSFSADYWKGRIRTRLFLLAGNHDSGHNAEEDAVSMVVDLNQNWRCVSVGHYPSCSSPFRTARSGRKTAARNSVNGYKGWNGMPGRPHVHLCGHVHSGWLFMFDSAKNVLNVNVGVDVWEYRPVEDVELTEFLDYVKTHLWQRFSAGTDIRMSRAEFDAFKTAKNEEIRIARVQRRADRLKAKGLTPEECERRREAAMAAKRGQKEWK